MPILAQLATAALILSGLWLLVHKKRAGWLFMLFAGFAYLYAYWVSELYVLIGVQFVFMATNVAGYRKWKEERKK